MKHVDDDCSYFFALLSSEKLCKITSRFMNDAMHTFTHNLSYYKEELTPTELGEVVSAFVPTLITDLIIFMCLNGLDDKQVDVMIAKAQAQIKKRLPKLKEKYKEHKEETKTEH